MKKFGKKHDDFSGNPFDPVMIQRRNEALKKIESLAQTRRRITIEIVQEKLGINHENAIRYLEYLVTLGRIARLAERGQEPYYELIVKET